MHFIQPHIKWASECGIQMQLPPVQCPWIRSMHRLSTAPIPSPHHLNPSSPTQVLRLHQFHAVNQPTRGWLPWTSCRRPATIKFPLAPALPVPPLQAKLERERSALRFHQGPNRHSDAIGSTEPRAARQCQLLAADRLKELCDFGLLAHASGI